MGFELDPPPQGSSVQQPGQQPPPSEGFVLDKPPEKTRDWNTDALIESASNFLPSIGKQVGETAEGLYHAASHPIDTATNIGKLVLSLDPTVHHLAGLIGPMLNDQSRGKLEEFINDIEGPKKAIIKDYMEAYGGKQEFLKTFATDPARILSDVAAIATGGEGALARLPGQLGRTSGAVARGLQMLDPVQAAVSGARGATNLAAAGADITTNTGTGVMREALRRGFEGGPQSDALRAARRGEVPMEDIVGAANDALNGHRQEMMADYRRSMGQWNQSNQTLPFNAISQAQADVFNSLRTRSGSNTHMKVSQGDQNRIQGLFDIVSEWRNDPSTHTIEGLDGLKQRLRNEVDFRTDSRQVTRAAQQMIDAVMGTITNHAPPQYRTAMRNYAEASNAINDMERAFGIGRKTDIQNAMSKLQSTMRNNANTQYGWRSQQLDRLNADLRATLAGHATSSWDPRGLGRAIAGTGGAGAIGALAATGNVLPALGVGAGMLATSPRLMGGTFQNLGRAAGFLSGRRLPRGLRDPLDAVSRPAFSPLGYNAARMEDRATGDPYSGFNAGGSVKARPAFARYHQ